MGKKSKNPAEDILNMMRAQFGDSVKGYWVYEDDLCPCCLKRRIDMMNYKGSNAVSVNAFMYGERGVLIAYLLCGQCGMDIMEESENGPTVLHTAIEKNLVSAYLRHLN